MFFYASKTLWFLAQPLSLVVGIIAVATAAAIFGRRGLAVILCASCFLVLSVCMWTSLGDVLIARLEAAYVRPSAPPEALAGIVLLGGMFEARVNGARGGYEVNEAADRILEALILARRYPDARIIITGTAATVFGDAGVGDAETALELMTAFGIPSERIVLENRSRDTYENAIFSGDLLNPKPGDRWLLVTSAFHMPRAMALFRKAGFDVVPWPTDYRSTGGGFNFFREDPASAIQKTTTALREWVGLFAYWIVGRIDSPWPRSDADNG